MLGNPFGIDNMYVAAATPLVVMAVERLVMGRAPAAATTPQPNALMERTSI